MIIVLELITAVAVAVSFWRSGRRIRGVGAGLLVATAAVAPEALVTGYLAVVTPVATALGALVGSVFTTITVRLGVK